MPTMGIEALRQAANDFGNRDADERISGDYPRSGVHPIPPVTDFYSEEPEAPTVTDYDQFSRVFTPADASRLFGTPLESRRRGPADSQRRPKVRTDDGVRVLTTERAAVRDAYAEYLEQSWLYYMVGEYPNLRSAIDALFKAASMVKDIPVARGELGEQAFLLGARLAMYGKVDELVDEGYRILERGEYEEIQPKEEASLSDFQWKVAGRREQVESMLADIDGTSDPAIYAGPRQLPDVIVEADDVDVAAPVVEDADMALEEGAVRDSGVDIINAGALVVGLAKVG